jgi:hypothetical protein
MRKVSINIAKALMKNEGKVFGNSFTKVDSLVSEVVSICMTIKLCGGRIIILAKI